MNRVREVVDKSDAGLALINLAFQLRLSNGALRDVEVESVIDHLKKASVAVENDPEQLLVDRALWSVLAVSATANLSPDQRAEIRKVAANRFLSRLSNRPLALRVYLAFDSQDEGDAARSALSDSPIHWLAAADRDPNVRFEAATHFLQRPECREQALLVMAALLRNEDLETENADAIRLALEDNGVDQITHGLREPA